MDVSSNSIFVELLKTAESVSLSSRNHNNELLGIDCYQQLNLLDQEQLASLETAWQRKRRRAQKEKISAQFMIVQMILLMLLASVCAWLIGGIVGIVTSLVGILGLFIVVDSKRVTVAKQNLNDSERVCNALRSALQSSPN